MSDTGSLGLLLLCVNTWYAIIVHDKCCFNLKCLLNVRHILIWQYLAMQVIAIHAFPKIYLDIEMSDFKANNKNIMTFVLVYTTRCL